jgi:hypothetical protein
LPGCTDRLPGDRPPHDPAGDWQNVAECTTRNRIGYIIFWPSEAGMMANTPSIAIPPFRASLRFRVATLHLRLATLCMVEGCDSVVNAWSRLAQQQTSQKIFQT